MIDRVAIIDLDPLIHIVAHAQFRAGNTKNAKVLTEHLDTMINSILSTSDSTENIMFFQDKGHKNFRNTILPEYKGHRVVQEALEVWKGIICEHLKGKGAHPLLEIESDDALFIYSKKVLSEGSKYLIVENDKDLAMIPGDHYNPYKAGMVERFFTYSERESRLSLYSQAMTGDPTDMPNELCGIQRCGPKTARKLLEKVPPELYPMKVLMEYINKYGETGGINRMALTYNMVNLLSSPVEHIPESKRIINLTTTKAVDPLAGLFM